jgi:uncharacterized membrane protein YciS (DUF1049 family)
MTLLVLGLVIAGMFFGSINQQAAELNYFIAKAQLRVVDISLIFLVLGFLLGLSISLAILLRTKTQRWLQRTAPKP